MEIGISSVNELINFLNFLSSPVLLSNIPPTYVIVRKNSCSPYSGPYNVLRRCSDIKPH